MKDNTYLENGTQAERNENNSQKHAGIVDLLVSLLAQRKGSVCQDSFIRREACVTTGRWAKRRIDITIKLLKRYAGLWE